MPLEVCQVAPTREHYEDFGRGCFRAGRRVYEAVPPPWFDFGYNETLTQKTQCECRYFAKRLSEGPLQVGVIGRLTELVPIPTTPGDLTICSPHRIPLGGV